MEKKPMIDSKREQSKILGKRLAEMSLDELCRQACTRQENPGFEESKVYFQIMQNYSFIQLVKKIADLSKCREDVSDNLEEEKRVL